MGTNPCCMPLNIAVKIVCHLSMALAIAVGFMGVRLISISLEVTTNPTLHQQHHHPISSLQLQNEEARQDGWKSDLMMKDGRVGGRLIYPEEEDEFNPSTTATDGEGLAQFSSNHNFLPSSSVSRDFMLQYSKALLVCGLMAVSASVFQFLCSCLLLCFINWEEKAPSQIWVAVNCSILFCLATCLVLFLCEGHSVPAYSMDERLFLGLVTADTLLSIYFLWIVISFI